MARKPPRIELHTAPHAVAAQNVVVIMRNVVYALLPLLGYAVWLFGLSAFMLILAVLLSTLGTERFFNWMGKQGSTLDDWSAVITALLLALTLPPGFPLWMGVIAGITSIALGKALFGGLGFNLLNPALVGRAFVQAAFPVAITTWTPPFIVTRFTEFIPSTFTLPLMQPIDISQWLATSGIDAFTGATPLALQKFQSIATPVESLFMGSTAGSVGETSAILILLCGSYLAVRKMMNWRIPLYIFFGVVATSALLQLIDDTNPDPLFMLLSGGVMLGAVFMATDMVGSPITPRGIMIYGVLIGFLTVIIRIYGGLSEGVMYAILLGNAATPLIEMVTQPRIFGARKAPAKGGTDD